MGIFRDVYIIIYIYYVVCVRAFLLENVNRYLGIIGI